MMLSMITNIHKLIKSSYIENILKAYHTVIKDESKLKQGVFKY